MKCSVCTHEMNLGGVTTQVFRRDGVVVTVTGIPAQQLCDHCGNAVLDWDVAQQVEELVQPIFQWAATHSLPKPIITITFPELVLTAV